MVAKTVCRQSRPRKKHVEVVNAARRQSFGLVRLGMMATSVSEQGACDRRARRFEQKRGGVLRQGHGQREFARATRFLSGVAAPGRDRAGGAGRPQRRLLIPESRHQSKRGATSNRRSLMQVPMPSTEPTQSTQSNKYFRFMTDLVEE
jgi:hypothetical protein